MRVDDLDEYSREFYERALFKRCLSLVFAAIGMVCLGWCSEAGANAQVQNIAYNGLNVSELNYSVYMSLGAGFGFACFAYLMASLSAICIALYISPDIASEYEKRILVTQFLVDPSIDHKRYGHADAALIPADGEEPEA